MEKTLYQHNLPASAAAAWAVFSRFEDLMVWHALGLELEVVGEGIGMVRTLVIPDFGRVGERLDMLDHAARQQVYTLVEGQPLGMQTYSAKIHIQATETNHARIHWEGQFTVAANMDAAKVGESLKGSYIAMSNALATYLQDHRATHA